MVCQDGTGQICYYGHSNADVSSDVVVVQSETSVNAVVDGVRNEPTHEIIEYVILVAEHFESCGGVVRSRDGVGGHRVRGTANI
jgi:hypothetical protein